MVVDDTGVVEKLLDRSANGKVPWEATADDQTYIATLKGNTFKMSVYTNQNGWPIPVLTLIDEGGKEVWRQEGRGTRYPDEPLSQLYILAQRIGDRVDEKLNAAMGILDALD